MHTWETNKNIYIYIYVYVQLCEEDLCFCFRKVSKMVEGATTITNCPCGPPGPCVPALMGWALMGRALMGAPGPLWARPLGPGPCGRDPYRPGPSGPGPYLQDQFFFLFPLPPGPRQLMSYPHMHIYVYMCVDTLLQPHLKEVVDATMVTSLV